MTPEELLKPRYKCIADYPCAIHKVGDIIETYESAMSYSVEVSGITEKICLQDYPVLFQKLEWWECRQRSELPEYIKSKRAQCCYKKVEEGESVRYINPQGAYFLLNLSAAIPATLEEYNAYQSSIKDTTLTNKIK